MDSSPEIDTSNTQPTHSAPSSISTPQNPSSTHPANSSSTLLHNSTPITPSTHTLHTDKIQRVAENLYAELEKNLNLYGEESIKSLIPLLAGLIEDYQNTLLQKEKVLCEIELHKEDNEQLLNHFEREKHLRKKCEERAMENEDFYWGWGGETFWPQT